MVRQGDGLDDPSAFRAFCSRLPDGLSTHRGEEAGATIDHVVSDRVVSEGGGDGLRGLGLGQTGAVGKDISSAGTMAR
jgi:hypothetical protein